MLFCSAIIILMMIIVAIGPMLIELSDENKQKKHRED